MYFTSVQVLAGTASASHERDAIAVDVVVRLQEVDRRGDRDLVVVAGRDPAPQRSPWPGPSIASTVWPRSASARPRQKYISSEIASRPPKSEHAAVAVAVAVGRYPDSGMALIGR